jgi:hypothetical protein
VLPDADDRMQVMGLRAKFAPLLRRDGEHRASVPRNA